MFLKYLLLVLVCCGFFLKRKNVVFSQRKWKLNIVGKFLFLEDHFVLIILLAEFEKKKKQKITI